MMMKLEVVATPRGQGESQGSLGGSKESRRRFESNLVKSKPKVMHIGYAQ